MIPEPGLGELRDLVKLRLWADVPNGLAGLDQTFDAGTDIFAKIEPVGGATYWGTKQTGESITDRFYVHYLEGVTAQHVIEYEGRRYRVKRTAPLGNARRFTMIETTNLGAIA